MARAITSAILSDALQWVRGPITAVMCARTIRFVHRLLLASMGPRSDNRGYGHGGCPKGEITGRLQWVRGPITAVMPSPARGTASGEPASMGPRSDNRGYASRLEMHKSQQLRQASARGCQSVPLQLQKKGEGHYANSYP